jgi:hypothetical protein
VRFVFVFFFFLAKIFFAGEGTRHEHRAAAAGAYLTGAILLPVLVQKYKY